MPSRRSRYLRHRFPPDIISHAVWLYHRYGLSFRDVEDLLAERGIIVSYETIRGIGARLFRVTPEAIVGRLVLRTTQAHDRDMKSRVHPKYKTKYHVQNWASYERALVRRGNVTVWLSPEAIAAWEPDGGGTRGGSGSIRTLPSKQP